MTPDMREPEPPKGTPEPTAGLRPQAEARLDELMQSDVEIELPEVRRLVHELSVHQIELETQNEELRRAQAALETSTGRYADLYNEAPIAYVTVGAGGRILDCNRRAEEVFGAQQSALQRQRLFDFMASDGIDRFAREREALLETSQPRSFELRMRRARGAGFWAEVSMNLSHEPYEQSSVCRVAIVDVSERKRMQDTDARLAAIVLSADLGIISHSLSGAITAWNAGAERLYGYSAKEMMGKGVETLVPADRITEEHLARERVMRGETVAEEKVHLRKDRSLVPVFVTISPVYDSAGRITGISQIARDVSEQVASRERLTRLLDELRSSEQALKDADRRKDDFIAILAHELRNPLAPIRNAAAVLHYAPELDPKVAWCRDVIDRQVEHMAALLDDLLDVSRITRNRIQLRRNRMELGLAISRAVEAARPLIDEKGHELILDLPADPIEVFGDLTRLTQAFGNLLNNAAKYSEPGGRIELRVELADSVVRVSVKDSGIGIDAAQLPHLFTLFWQVDPALERSHGGLGIGLSLVKALIDLHGGTVEVFSEGLGKGTEFVVTLPVVNAASPRTTPASEFPALNVADPVKEPTRVLVADDNADAAETLAVVLEGRGFEVRTVRDGAAALTMMETFQPHAVVLDLGMPGMNGYETARRIREMPGGKDLLLVAATGWGQLDDVRRTHEAGFDQHVVKPFSVDVLVTLLAEREPRPTD